MNTERKIEELTLQQLPISHDIEEIKKEAKKVVKLRKKHAGAVKDYVIKLAAFKETFVSGLLYIEDNLATDHPEAALQNIEISTGETESGKKQVSLVELCKEVRILFGNFEDTLKALQQRFENEKILVTSIGKARQGKSLLTQYYTGRSDIIKVKGSAQDCTGSVCILHHDKSKKGNDFHAVITFYKKEEALKSLNTLLGELKSKKFDVNLPNGELPKSFSSFNEVKAIIDDKSQKEAILTLSVPSGIDQSVLDAFKHYFRNGDYINCLSNDPKDDVTTVEVLEEYNYIPSPKPKWLAVRQIDLFANFGHQGLFENFEIADSRGASVTAGSSANEDIHSAIQKSDAVFSIHRQAKGKVDSSFYNTILDKYKGDDLFKRKHFIIINEEDYSTDSKDADEVDIPNTLKTIQENNTSWVYYIGKLVDSTHPDDPKAFAERMMANMLSRIASEVRDFDQARVDECKTYIENLHNYATIIKSELEKLNLFTRFDEDLFISKFITDFSGEIGKLLSQKRKELGYNGVMQPNYDQLYKDKDKSIITLSELVLGRKSDNEDSLNVLVPILINEVCEKLRGFEEPNAKFIGSYLQEFALCFSGKLESNLRNKTREQKINIHNEKNDLFKAIWEISKIGVIYKETLPGRASKESGSPYVSALVELYEREKHDGIKDSMRIFSPYRLLSLYFKQVTDKLDEEKEDGNIPVLEKEKLEQIMIQLVSELHFDKFVRQGLVEKKEVINNLYTDLTNFFNNIIAAFKENENSKNCKEFYRKHKEVVTAGNPEYEEKTNLCNRENLLDQKRNDIIKNIPSILKINPLELPNEDGVSENE